MPGSLMSIMQAAAVPMLTQPVVIPPLDLPKDMPPTAQARDSQERGLPGSANGSGTGTRRSPKKSYTAEEQGEG